MRKKRVLMNYMEYEGDAFRDYLEEMALKGWMLEKISNVILTFTPVEPHPIRYDVELMEGASVYDSVQTPGQKGYREFCREEGWEYIGTNGLLHVFRTENPDALPVETDDQIRYERILKGNTGVRRMMYLVFGLVILSNLFACFTRKSAWNVNGFCMLLITAYAAYYIINMGLWRKRAKQSMEQTGRLPGQDWRKISLKNNLAMGVTFVFCFFIILQIVSGMGGSIFGIVFVIYLGFYVSLFFVFSRIIKWLREKKSFSRGANIAIYWGSALLIIVAGVGLCLLAIRILLPLFW